MTIQSICNYTAFNQIDIHGIDINTDEFRLFVESRRPTHAACIIGLHQEESCFLSAVAGLPSVQTIAIAERRDQPDPFDAYGFERIARVKVNITGSHQIKYVLIATRKNVS